MKITTKARIVLMVIPLLLVLAVAQPAIAADELRVLDSAAQVDFPAGITFSLSAESETDVTDIRLNYTVERMSHAPVVSEVYLEFPPDTRVATEWYWDMRKTGGLPPGTEVDYWWTVTDAGGTEIETKPVTIHIEDNRYEWQSLTRDKISLYWYEGDDAFAGKLMTAAQQALDRVSRDTGVELEKTASIYIYANSRDLRGSMIFPQEWTGGVAFTRYGTVAIGIEPDNLEWGSRVIAHEFTHLVIHQMIFNPYGDLPTWLDEGLAMYAEGEMQPYMMSLLKESIEEDSLISVRSLSSPFSAYAGESMLAYAQSHSLVQFLIERYGQEEMYELLCIFKQGSQYDDALFQVYGFDMDGLDSQWQVYLQETVVSEPEIGMRIHGWTLFLIIVGTILLVVVLVLLWYFGRLGTYRS